MTTYFIHSFWVFLFSIQILSISQIFHRVLFLEVKILYMHNKNNLLNFPKMTRIIIIKKWHVLFLDTTNHDFILSFFSKWSLKNTMTIKHKPQHIQNYYKNSKIKYLPKEFNLKNKKLTQIIKTIQQYPKGNIQSKYILLKLLYYY